VAVEAFRKTLCHKLQEKQIPLKASVHLWVLDEMRFGPQPVTRRVWTLPGVEVVVPVCPRYQWRYTSGAPEIGGEGGAQFFNTTSVKSSVVGFPSELRPVMRTRITLRCKTELIFTCRRGTSGSPKK
jgi:hypothetical protein